MSDFATKAVFLSYASQDAEAAKRICEALRAAGVEVWFDQSELRGGDSWDAKIRGQIGSCALFVPIISANTQARLEGYFRREWKQAAARTHDMADERTFLLPVVIDGTKDGVATVPAEFKAVQWTRLPGGGDSEKFCTRVDALLRGDAATARLPVGAPLADTRGRGQAAPLRKRSRSWVAPVIIGTVLLVAAGAYFALKLRHSPEETAGIISGVQVAATTAGAHTTPAAPLSEAHKLAARADAMFDQTDNATRDELDLAEQLCKQALALDANDAEIHAIYSRLLVLYLTLYDPSAERREAARIHAFQAAKLAPDSDEAQLALANFYRLETPTQPEAEKILRALVKRRPDFTRARRALGNTLKVEIRFEEAIAVYQQAAALPGGDPLSVLNEAQCFTYLGRNAEAEAVVDQLIATHPMASAYSLKVALATWRGDFASAATTLDLIPADRRLNSYYAYGATRLWFWSHQPEKALTLLRSMPGDFLEGYGFTGPKDYLVGLALFLTQRPEMAATAWRAALQAVDRRLALTPTAITWMAWKAVLHARLGEMAEARRMFTICAQMRGSNADVTSESGMRLLAARLSDVERGAAVDELTRSLQKNFFGFRGAVQFDPDFEQLRAEAWFKAAVEDGRRDNAQEAATPILSDKSIAVLPFTNMSEDKDSGYFADGVQEDILTSLASLRDLRVVSRTSVEQYRQSTKPMPQIARELGVAYILEGSVRRAGNKVRVTGQLIHAATDEHVWAQAYDRDLTDVFAIQSELATAIAGELKAALSPQEKSRLARAPTSDLGAYELCLKAGEMYERADYQLDRLIAAEALLQQAVELDPKFTAAWTAMAGWNYLIFNRLTGRPAERPARLDKARRAIAMVEKLAPNEPETWLALAGFYSQEAEYAKAEAYLQRAAEALPNSAQVTILLADADARHGRYREALARYRRAFQADRQEAGNRKQLLEFLIHVRRYDEAEAVLREFPQPLQSATLAFYRSGFVHDDIPSGDPTVSGGNWAWRSGDAATYVRQVDGLRRQQGDVRFDGGTESRYLLSLVALGETDRARKRAEEFLTINPRSYLALAVLGRKQEALAEVEAYIARVETRGMTLWSLDAVQKAQVLAWSGDKEGAIAEIARLLQTPSALNVYELRRSVAWRPLQGDPRFEALLNDPANNAPLF